MHVRANEDDAVDDAGREVDDVRVDDGSIAQPADLVEGDGEEDVSYGRACHPSERL